MSDRNSTHDASLAMRRAERWRARRSFGAADAPPARDLAACARAEGLTISVALPALNEEPTVGTICASMVRELMERTHLVDELVVVDGGSSDGTIDAARAAGAQVVRAHELLPHVPAVAGKGESLWRSLALLRGDVVCWIDADIRNFAPHFVTRLVAPLVIDSSVSFVKATYRRPLAIGDILVPDGGGRVTELLARPLLAELFPELSCVRQPLAGEYAGRRDVLASVPFFSGYSVEVGLLIDLLDAIGLDAIAEADLGERVHRNRPLSELAPMAHAIARTIMLRARECGRLGATPDHRALLDAFGQAGEALEELERPPIDSLLVEAAG